MQGNANVLRAESKQDGGNKIKDDQAAALQEKSSSLMGEVTDVNDTLKPDDDAKAEEASKEEAMAKKAA